MQLGDRGSVPPFWYDGDLSSSEGMPIHIAPQPKPKVAYFCMEYGLGETLPLYAGGLGVLAGDHLKAAGDLGLPLTAVGLLWRQRL